MMFKNIKINFILIVFLIFFLTKKAIAAQKERRASWTESLLGTVDKNELQDFKHSNLVKLREVKDKIKINAVLINENKNDIKDLISWTIDYNNRINDLYHTGQKLQENINFGMNFLKNQLENSFSVFEKKIETWKKNDLNDIKFNANVLSMLYEVSAQRSTVLTKTVLEFVEKVKNNRIAVAFSIFLSLFCVAVLAYSFLKIKKVYLFLNEEEEENAFFIPGIKTRKKRKIEKIIDIQKDMIVNKLTTIMLFIMFIFAIMMFFLIKKT